MTPRPSCNELAQYARPLPRRASSCEQEAGWSAWTRKRPFKHAKASSLLAQHAQVGRCCTKRYHRRGACNLFAGWSVAEGKVYGSCRRRKCFVDFQAFLQQVIIPEALRRKVQTVIFILDNGTTHAPKQLEGWLGEQELACQRRLHFQVLWLPVNASWLDQIEIWFSVLQRKHLQPNHFLSTSDLERSLNTYIAYHNQAAKPINWTYTVEKLEQKLGKQL